MSPPVITSLSAGPQGTNQGNLGQTLTIFGTGLADVTRVDVGARSVPATASPSGTTVTCVLPPGHGTVTVTVTAPDGTSNPLPFYYVDSPILTGIAPPWGPAVAPPEMTIFGRHLLTANEVLIGGVPAALTPPTSDSQVNVTAQRVSPVGAIPWVQMKDVSVRTAGGTATAPDAFTFFDPPVIEALAPTTALAGTQILVQGTAFVSPTIRAHFVSGGTQRDGTVVVNSSALLLVTVPSGLTGTADVHVDTLGGRSNAASFTYQ